MFQRLYEHFGPQDWWPGDTPFEVMVGAILTQNTNWKNVEKAIQNLKSAGVLTPSGLLGLSDEEMAELIRPAGYFNVKTQRLKAFLKFFQEEYDSSVQGMRQGEMGGASEKIIGSQRGWERDCR